ncbi:hypothetical protein HY988_00055 [Candidatus Micrarchaeota archaeon]|nr:hypothetical protein [Candidatus Micrarchaeota archaeon]
MRSLYQVPRPQREDAGRIWSSRLFLHPIMQVLGDGKDKLDPRTFVESVRNRFFPLDSELSRVQKEFISAMNRGSDTLNYLAREHLPPEHSSIHKLFAAGHFHDVSSIQILLEDARARYRSLKGSNNGDPKNWRTLYEVIRGLEIGHQVLRIDTEKEVQLSLRYYVKLMD